MKGTDSSELMKEVQRSDDELKTIREQHWKMKMVEIGQRIQKERKALGLSQEQLAVAVGVSLNSISSIERGIFSPALDTFHEICDALMVSPDYLLFGKRDLSEFSNAVQILLRMSPHEQEIVERLLLNLHWLKRYDLPDNQDERK